MLAFLIEKEKTGKVPRTRMEQLSAEVLRWTAHHSNTIGACGIRCTRRCQQQLALATKQDTQQVRVLEWVWLAQLEVLDAPLRTGSLVGLPLLTLSRGLWPTLTLPLEQHTQRTCVVFSNRSRQVRNLEPNAHGNWLS